MNDEAAQKALWKEKRLARQQRNSRPATEDAFADLGGDDDDGAEDAPLTAAQKRRREQQQMEKYKRQRRRGGPTVIEDEGATDETPTTTDEAAADDAAVADGPPTDPNAPAPAPTEVPAPNGARVQSLLEEAAALQQQQGDVTAEDRVARNRQHEEELLLRHAQQVGGKALQTAKDHAAGTVFTHPMPSTWQVPRHILAQGEEAWQAMRQEWHVDVEGTDIPPPMTRFVDMKLAGPMIDCLHSKGITRPTPIQMQGIPVALAGRDMVGVAFTGSGKTFTFALPLVMAALEEELRMPLAPREGPIGAILAPSRELARQTYDGVQDFCTHMAKTKGYPLLRALLLIGGESLKEQAKMVENEGVHCVVATPGRLKGMLKSRIINFDICRFICLDEADRLMELGFDEEVGEIFNFFKKQKQTLLFSATFPQKFRDFARQTLIQPIVVNVGRAGAANLDVIQEVEYVKQEAKVVYLLHCLQKTAPPVCIFTARQREVDEIHEYLLLKGVEAVSLHGGKTQEERNEAIQSFKDGRKDVLIATDVAAKGLDFAAVQVSFMLVVLGV
jgi:ATP-dependent RNA helicase DDX41